MDRFVVIEKLPAAFVIPRDMKDRLSYDAGTRRLICRGYMSKTEFDRLSQLTGDWGFRRKLEELFRSCAYNDQSDARPRGGRLAGLWKRFVPG